MNIEFAHSPASRSLSVLPTFSVNILGAAGAGTSTLGRVLAQHMACEFVEGDDLFWEPTEPPYQKKRDADARLTLALATFDTLERVVVAGSFCGWGSEVENSFDAIVFLSVPAEVRVRRVLEREQQRFGQANPEFIEWVAQYEEGRLPGRSRAKHEAWLQGRTCPILRIEGEIALEDSLAETRTFLRKQRIA
jgi:adenylate kinase family enzyme